MSNSKKKVLYVEDNLDNQFLIKYYLKTEPYELHIAGTGQQAIELIKSSEFDVFLVDLNLPDGYSGADIVEEIRKSETNSKKPVAVITAFTQRDRESNNVEIDADRFVTKPVKKPDFIQLLKELCA